MRGERGRELWESLLKQYKPEVTFCSHCHSPFWQSGCSDVNKDWIQVELVKSLLTWKTIEIFILISWGPRPKPWASTVIRRCGFISCWLALSASENKVCIRKGIPGCIHGLAFQNQNCRLKTQQLPAQASPGQGGLFVKSLADTLEQFQKLVAVVSCCLFPKGMPLGYPWHFSLSVYPLAHPEFTRLHMVFLGILASTEPAVALALLVSAHSEKNACMV